MESLRSPFRTITGLGEAPFVIFFFIGSFNLMPKPAALYFWCAMSAVIFFVSELRSLYAQDRPYWVTEVVMTDSCLLTFANPSGHMVSNVFFWLSLYLHWYNEVGVV